ncbi:MAG: hypothetical protein B7C24_05990 [Bacteroidetes bacterium 4572_77]|nr:MAG: hypothetical protein B7C24_05990 [Bacteroidetes bacterium 4572_77]
MLKKSKDSADIIVAKINLCQLAMDKSNFTRTLQYFHEALQKAKRINKNRLERISLYNLHKTHSHMGNWQLALDYHKEYSHIKDQIFDKQKATQYAIMQSRFETHKREKENELLKQEHIFQQNQIQTHKRLLFLSGIIILLLSVFSYIFYLQKKAPKELLKRNVEIMKSEKKLRSTKFLLETELYQINKTQNSEKYGSSSLSENKKEVLYHEICRLMDQEKLFTHIDISTQIIAQRTQSNKNYISQTINDYNGSNFSQFINEYRTKEARQLLSENTLNKYTIEAVRQMVGFKSKSTFYISFKKFTGITPSYYLNNIDKI